MTELGIELPVAHSPEVLDRTARRLADLVAVAVLQRQEPEDGPTGRRQLPLHFVSPRGISGRDSRSASSHPQPSTRTGPPGHCTYAARMPRTDRASRVIAASPQQVY